MNKIKNQSGKNKIDWVNEINEYVALAEGQVKKRCSGAI